MKIILIIMVSLSVTFFSSESYASSDNKEVLSLIESISKNIEKDPRNVKLYVQRSNLYDSIGKYNEAANDLKMQCDLSTSEDVKELCEDELKEYKKIRKLR